MKLRSTDIMGTMTKSTVGDIIHVRALYESTLKEYLCHVLMTLAHSMPNPLRQITPKIPFM